MYDFGYKPATWREAEDALYYWILRRKSYEAKLTRIEPDSEEFAETMERLFEVRKELDRLGLRRGQLRYRELEAQDKLNARQ